MSENTTKPVREMVDAIYRSESRQVLSTLIRLLGDFETAEEALHDAFAVAVDNGRAMVSRRIHEPGSSRQDVSKPLTAYDGALDMMRRWRNLPSNPKPVPAIPMSGTTSMSRTTGSG